MKSKSPKKPKVENIGKIHRRLFKLWSEAVRDKANHSCEVCGIHRGENNVNNKPTKIDAHHLYSRNIKDCPIKFDIRNGIAVDPICHKFGEKSFHKCPIFTSEWLKKNSPERFEFVLKYWNFRVDLENRKVLEQIESHLIKKEPLDLEKLREIETQYSRKSSKGIISGNIFESAMESSSAKESDCSS